MSFEIVPAETLLRFELELETIEHDIQSNIAMYDECLDTISNFTKNGVNKGIMIAFESRRLDGQEPLGAPIDSFTSYPSMTNLDYAVESLVDRAKAVFSKVSDGVVRFFRAIFDFVVRALGLGEKKIDEAEKDIIKRAKEADKQTEDNSELLAKHLVELSEESVLLNELISGSSRHDIAPTLSLLTTYVSDSVDLSNAAASKFQTHFKQAVAKLSLLTTLDVYEVLSILDSAIEFSKTAELQFLKSHLGDGDEVTVDNQRVLSFILSLGLIKDKDNGVLLPVLNNIGEVLKRKPVKAFDINTVNRDKESLVSVCSEVTDAVGTAGTFIRDSKGPLNSSVKVVASVNSDFTGRTSKLLTRLQKYYASNDYPNDGLPELNSELSDIRKQTGEFTKTLSTVGKSIATLTVLSMDFNLAAARVKSVCDNY